MAPAKRKREQKARLESEFHTRAAPNQALVAPRKARNLGIGGYAMKLVVVPQEVSTLGRKSSLINA
jgi:hypothetical protein